MKAIFLPLDIIIYMYQILLTYQETMEIICSMKCGKKSYGLMHWVILFLILSGFISFASGFESSQLQWDEGVSDKLQRGGVISYMGYSVKVAAFPSPVESDKYKVEPEEPVEPFVGLNISKNGRFIDTAILVPGDSYIVSDGELKVTALELPSSMSTVWLYESYTPWAVIELSPRGTPGIEVFIDIEQDNYTSLYDTDIVATVEIENTGSADAVNVDMNIVTELHLKRGTLKYHYDMIEKGDSITETVVFMTPQLLEQKEYEILANVSGYDVKDISYTAEYQKDVTIEAEPLMGLTIRKSANNRIYLRDYAMISLLLKNNGKDDLKNVSITDSLPDGFRLISNTTLHWVANIPAGGEWDYRYQVKPQESNKDGVVFPSASAEFTVKEEFFSIESNQPKIKVYGPKIVLTKEANVSGIDLKETANVITVTVTAENTGNTPTRVLIRDVLPENATIISGNNTYEEFLESDREVSFNYSIRIDSTPPIILPPAAADYYELGTKGGKINTVSEEIVIDIEAPEEIMPEPTPEETEPEPTPEINVTLPAVNESSDDSTSSSTIEREFIAILNFIFGCDENSTSNNSLCNFSAVKIPFRYNSTREDFD